LKDSWIFIQYNLEGHPVNLSDLMQYVNMGAIIPKEEKERILPYIQSHLGKISQREIARRLNIGKTTVNRWGTELGFESIKFTANENFFKEWSHDMSYILGYLFTDGNINWKPEKTYRALTLTASEKDKDHLELVRKKLSSSKPLLFSEKTRSYRMIVNNKTICQDLMRMGLTPRKSLTVKFPKIPKQYLPDFIRGVIDGDGTVRWNNRKRSPYFDISIASGSRDFAVGLVENIRKLGVDGKVRRQRYKLFIVQYCCTRGMKLAELIYGGANMFLNRKYQNYKMALEAKGGGQP
jgi:intein-encoded DNA endonuclease-like protein